MNTVSILVEESEIPMSSSALSLSRYYYFYFGGLVGAGEVLVRGDT